MRIIIGLTDWSVVILNGAKRIGLKFVTDILTGVAYPGEPTKYNGVTSLDNAYRGSQHRFHIIRCKPLKVKSVAYHYEKRPVGRSEFAFSVFLFLYQITRLAGEHLSRTLCS